ncbi:hypothetical protein NM688_g8847 [Phlebia brevispora]|uniref:Uncharacterized protein n=1 Tax=Phlebia brevispora TaxID=194682 RepID=A0ACC1RMR3_9APHY|nr:hypothetical protein NM688_g8847 [Phlebia brevispora]
MNDRDTADYTISRAYTGYVSGSVVFTVVAGEICLLATLYSAYRFYQEDRRRDNLYFDKFSSLSKRTVTCLCYFEVFHAISTVISSFVGSADISLGWGIASFWAMSVSSFLLLIRHSVLMPPVPQLSFFLTACIVLTGQIYIAYSVYQACGQSEWFIFNVAWAVLAFLAGIRAIFFGGVFVGSTLGTYLSLINMIAGCWSVFHGCTRGALVDHARSHADPLVKILLPAIKTISIIFFVYILAFQLPFLGYHLYYNYPNVWVYTDLVYYELIANSYPATLPGWESWNEDS